MFSVYNLPLPKTLPMIIPIVSEGFPQPDALYSFLAYTGCITKFCTSKYTASYMQALGI